MIERRSMLSEVVDESELGDDVPDKCELLIEKLNGDVAFVQRLVESSDGVIVRMPRLLKRRKRERKLADGRKHFISAGKLVENRICSTIPCTLVDRHRCYCGDAIII